MHENGYLSLLSHDSFAHGVPQKTFERLGKDDTVSWTHGDNDTKWFCSLTRHADISLANRESHIFSSAQGIRLEDQLYEEYLARRTFQETDSPEHFETRRKVNPLFAVRPIAEYESVIRSLAAGIVEDAYAQKDFYAVEAISKQLSMMMLGRILGLPDEGLEWLVEKGDALIGNSDPKFTSTVIDKMDTSAYRMMPFGSPPVVELYDYAPEVMAARRMLDKTGVLSQVLNAEKSLDELEFKFLFSLLIVAGNETTQNSISMALYLLSQNPALIAQLNKGDCWNTCADELIRRASPTMHFRRTATQDWKLHGKLIRKGDKVLLWLASGSRDEAMLKTHTMLCLIESPTDTWFLVKVVLTFVCAGI